MKSVNHKVVKLLGHSEAIIALPDGSLDVVTLPESAYEAWKSKADLNGWIDRNWRRDGLVMLGTPMDVIYF